MNLQWIRTIAYKAPTEAPSTPETGNNIGYSYESGYLPIVKAVFFKCFFNFLFF
jgi:hypothetical protein